MGLDSVELVMEVEKYFNISIPDAEAEKAYTVGKLVNCIANILGVNGYDFTLRDTTFSAIQNCLQQLTGKEQSYSITSIVKDNLDIENKPLIIQLESLLNLKLPGINTSSNTNNSLFQKLKTWINFSPHFNFEEMRWKKYIDVILAHNLEKTIRPGSISLKYEIYIVLMRIVVDKIGVDYLEMGIEKSFTDDLEID